mmetsp:Transcript_8064/g.13718  ORF Transcript_8064/g.13718 Transcript_8064/m.13718 type:complete len:125 (+) Transcript_8064:418-792(+)
MLYKAATVCILYEAATFLLCRLRRTDTTLLVASYYIQLGGIEMVLLCIDDYIASSILLLLTPNIKDCRYDHVIDSSTIIDRHVLLSHHENILLAGVLPISITNYVINRKTIHMMICYYHRSVTY